jgi:hypothetical protein
MLRHNVGGVGHYFIDNDQEKNTVNPYYTNDEIPVKNNKRIIN